MEEVSSDIYDIDRQPLIDNSEDEAQPLLRFTNELTYLLLFTYWNKMRIL